LEQRFSFTEVLMKNDPQATLFPDEVLTWETLPDDLQQAVQEIVSLLLEQALSHWPQVHHQEPETNHV
jgi:hypothetical protein